MRTKPLFPFTEKYVSYAIKKPTTMGLATAIALSIPLVTFDVSAVGIATLALVKPASLFFPTMYRIPPDHKRFCGRLLTGVAIGFVAGGLIGHIIGHFKEKIFAPTVPIANARPDSNRISPGVNSTIISSGPK